MSEQKRVPLQSLGTTKKEKKGEEFVQSYRFVLTLPESNEKACPEFNYRELLKSAEVSYNRKWLRLALVLFSTLSDASFHAKIIKIYNIYGVKSDARYQRVRNLSLERRFSPNFVYSIARGNSGPRVERQSPSRS